MLNAAKRLQHDGMNAHMSIEVRFVGCEPKAMDIPVFPDNELLAEAASLTGIVDRAERVRRAQKALIARESARRLAALGGSDSSACIPQRRRLR
jgi:hypothetical protein